MNERISINETLLDLITYIQSVKKQAISKSQLTKDENVNWLKITRDTYYELDKTFFEKAGILQNTYNFEKILSYQVTDDILQAEYAQLGKFLF